MSSSTQSNERPISATNVSESGSSTVSLVSNTASTSLSTVVPTKTIIQTATETVTTTKITTVTTTATPEGNSGLSKSGIVAVAVGSVAAVALVLCVFLCAYIRIRLLSRQVHVTRIPHRPLMKGPDVSPETSSKEPGVATGFVGLPNRSLLTGASDSDIKRQLRSLGLLIHNHVESHYHHDDVLVTLGTLYKSLRQLHLTENTCRKVARLSIDPSTRYIAIRHLLALVIFSNLDTHTVGSLSLLPSTLRELSQSRVTAPMGEQDSLVETALTSWHRITAFLMHENPEKRTPLLPPPNVKPQVEALMTLLQESLVHFVRVDNDQSLYNQQAGLAGVIRQSVMFGYEVFSHPSDWEFIFPQDTKGLVVVPGLNQHSSNTGERYNPPKIVLTPEIIAGKSAKD